MRRKALPLLAAENIRSTYGGAKGMVPSLLLQGENATDYADLAATVLTAAAQPKDFIEELHSNRCAAPTFKWRS